MARCWSSRGARGRQACRKGSLPFGLLQDLDRRLAVVLHEQPVPGTRAADVEQVFVERGQELLVGLPHAVRVARGPAEEHAELELGVGALIADGRLYVVDEARVEAGAQA